MGQRNLSMGRRGRVAIAALALLILTAGLCCLDQDQGGMDDQSMLMDLCFLMLAVPPVIPLLAGPLSRGFVVNILRPAFAAVPLAVPKPPPRCSCLA
jgi:hypothetical protein